MPKGVELVKAARLVRQLPSCRAVAVATVRRPLSVSPPQLGTPRERQCGFPDPLETVLCGYWAPEIDLYPLRSDAKGELSTTSQTEHHREGTVLD